MKPPVLAVLSFALFCAPAFGQREQAFDAGAPNALESNPTRASVQSLQLFDKTLEPQALGQAVAGLKGLDVASPQVKDAFRLRVVGLAVDLEKRAADPEMAKPENRPALVNIALGLRVIDQHFSFVCDDEVMRQRMRDGSEQVQAMLHDDEKRAVTDQAGGIAALLLGDLRAPEAAGTARPDQDGVLARKAAPGTDDGKIHMSLAKAPAPVGDDILTKASVADLQKYGLDAVEQIGDRSTLDNSQSYGPWVNQITNVVGLLRYRGEDDGGKAASSALNQILLKTKSPPIHIDIINALASIGTAGVDYLTLAAVNPEIMGEHRVTIIKYLTELNPPDLVARLNTIFQDTPPGWGNTLVKDQLRRSLEEVGSSEALQALGRLDSGNPSVAAGDRTVAQILSAARSKDPELRMAQEQKGQEDARRLAQERAAQEQKRREKAARHLNSVLAAAGVRPQEILGKDLIQDTDFDSRPNWYDQQWIVWTARDGYKIEIKNDGIFSFSFARQKVTRVPMEKSYLALSKRQMAWRLRADAMAKEYSLDRRTAAERLKASREEDKIIRDRAAHIDAVLKKQGVRPQDVVGRQFVEAIDHTLDEISDVTRYDEVWVVWTAARGFRIRVQDGKYELGGHVHKDDIVEVGLSALTPASKSVILTASIPELQNYGITAIKQRQERMPASTFKLWNDQVFEAIDALKARGHDKADEAADALQAILLQAKSIYDQEPVIHAFMEIGGAKSREYLRQAAASSAILPQDRDQIDHYLTTRAGPLVK